MNYLARTLKWLAKCLLQGRLKAGKVNNVFYLKLQMHVSVECLVFVLILPITAYLHCLGRKSGANGLVTHIPTYLGCVYNDRKMHMTYRWRRDVLQRMFIPQTNKPRSPHFYRTAYMKRSVCIAMQQSTMHYWGIANGVDWKLYNCA